MAEPTNKVYCCPVELAVELIGSKWKPTLLRQLGVGIHCFGELRRRMPLVSQRVLGQLLRELERDGLVKRNLHPGIPPRVEYQLTRDGRRLGPILGRLAAFGNDYAARHEIKILSEAEGDEELAAVAALPATPAPRPRRRMSSPALPSALAG